MAYESIERLLSRRGEKIAAFLTVENAVGVAALAGPFFVIGGIALLPRAIIIVLAAALGVAITLETDGMLFCERLLWRARGECRLLLRGRTLSPEDLPGTRAAVAGHRAVAHAGAVRKSRRRGAAPAQATSAARAGAPAREAGNADRAA